MNFVTCINFGNDFPFCIWCASIGDTQEHNLTVRVIVTPRGKLQVLECVDIAACCRRQDARAASHGRRGAIVESVGTQLRSTAVEA